MAFYPYYMLYQGVTLLNKHKIQQNFQVCLTDLKTIKVYLKQN